MYILTIIDLQSFFVKFNTKKFKNIKQNIIREIKIAKRNSYPIFVVEFSGWWSDDGQINTLPSIMRPIKNYENTFIINKYKDDGSEKIDNIANKYIHTKNIRILGVNTDACILKTVRGLSQKYYNVQVIADSCASFWDDNKQKWDTNHKWGLSKISKINCVKIMRQNGTA